MKSRLAHDDRLAPGLNTAAVGPAGNRGPHHSNNADPLELVATFAVEQLSAAMAAHAGQKALLSRPLDPARSPRVVHILSKSLRPGHATRPDVAGFHSKSTDQTGDDIGNPAWRQHHRRRRISPKSRRRTNTQQATREWKRLNGVHHRRYPGDQLPPAPHTPVQSPKQCKTRPITPIRRLGTGISLNRFGNNRVAAVDPTGI